MNLDHQKALTSLLQGDGIRVNRILARDSSVGHSSRIYYRKPEGVPLAWEKQPGTPKARPEEEALPPLSPPPQVLSLRLPKPCLDHLPDIDESDHSGVRFWKKMKVLYQLDKKAQFPQTLKLGGDLDLHKDRSDGDSAAEFNNSCSTSSFSSSSNSSNCHANGMESPFQGDFCCSPWNISVILDEGDRKVYYCRVHKTAFAVENDGSVVGKTLPRNSSVGQSFRPYYRSSDDGIPFKWEMQPGTPKNQPENDLIPPPSPPPAVQGLGLKLPANLDYSDDDEAPGKHKGSKLWRFLFWISSKKMHRGSDTLSRSSSLSSSSSSSSGISTSKPNGLMKLSKFRRDILGGYLCFHPSKA